MNYSRYTKTDTKIINTALLKAFKLIGRKRLFQKEKDFLYLLFDNFIYFMIDEYSGMSDLIRDCQQFEDENDSCYQGNIENFMWCLPLIKKWYYRQCEVKKHVGLEYMWKEVREFHIKIECDEKALSKLLDYLI